MLGEARRASDHTARLDAHRSEEDFRVPTSKEANALDRLGRREIFPNSDEQCSMSC